MNAVKASKLTGAAAFALLVAIQAASAGPPTGERRTVEQIRACIAEIGERAEYDDAVRVRHEVSRLYQRNLVELDIRVTTLVYAQDDETAARTYSAACLTSIDGELLRFRMEEAPVLAGRTGEGS